MKWNGHEMHAPPRSMIGNRADGQFSLSKSCERLPISPVVSLGGTAQKRLGMESDARLILYRIVSVIMRLRSTSPVLSVPRCLSTAAREK
jgi:hypothetical protein